MIGRYKVVTELGRSNTSVVYLATDRLTGARVAQRVVTGPVSAGHPAGEPDGGADREPARLWLTRRLCRLASLHHPNLVGILDYGFDPERRPYYVQRLLEDHRGLLAAGRGQPFETRVEYLLQILQGLTYLHHRGVVHGDLRPETVLVHGSRVRLVNFGLAPHESGASAYLAPEILCGESAGAAADLYAVGVLAWELFSGRDAGGGSASGLEMSTREIDGRLIPVLGGLLEVDRHRRCRDAALAIRDLCAALDRPPPEETAAIRRSFLEAGRLIDRRREMGRLRASLAALIEGRGSALLVAGESGVGKSRLVEELRTLSLAEGAVVLWGRAAAEGFSPFDSWRVILRHLCLLVEVEDEAAATLAARFPDFRELLKKDAGAPLAFDPQDARRRFLAVARGLFESLRQPAVVIFEDLHWAGSESLELLIELCREVSRLPLLFVATYRDDERPDLAVTLDEIPSLKLDRLGRRSVAELVESMLGPLGRRPELVERLADVAGGNAYFLVEATRALAEEAGGRDRIDPSRLPRRISTLGIREIVERRLRRLPRKVRPLLRLAAVAGRDVDLAVLEALQPDLQKDLWLRFCGDQAVLEHDRGRWRFASDVFRETLIGGMRAGELRSAHRRVAEAIAATHGTGPEQASKLAYHWTRAADPGDPEATGLAVDFLERAGDAALALCAHQEAVELLNQGLSFLAALPPSRRRARQEMRLRVDLGAAYLISRGFTAPEAGQAFSRARGLAEQTGDTSRLMPALIGQWRFHLVRGELPLARQLADETLRQARGVRGAAPRVLADYVAGTTILFQGDPKSATRYLERVIDRLSRLEETPRLEVHAVAFYLGHDPAVAACDYAAWAAWCLGFPEHARALDRRARVIADELDHPFSQAFARLLSAWLHHMRDDPRATASAASAAIKLSREHGFPDFLARATIFQSWAAARAGRSESAVGRIRDMLDRLRDAGAELFRPYYQALLADACDAAGRPEDGLGVLEEATREADRGGAGFWKPEMHRLRGELCLRLPSPNRRQAADSFARALGGARRRRERSLELRALLSQARLWRDDAPRLAGVLAELEKLYASFSEGHDSADLMTARRMLGSGNGE